MPKNYTKVGKRLIYMMFKKTNRRLQEFRRENNHIKLDNIHRVLLERMIKKGLVGFTQYPDGKIYFLTDSGDAIAKPIVDEIDEYKSW